MLSKTITPILNKFLRCPHVDVANGYLNEFKEFRNPQCQPSKTDSHDHLAWMLSEIVKNKMSRPKANRWLGYVQSKMEDKGMIKVADERNRTRPIFNGL